MAGVDGEGVRRGKGAYPCLIENALRTAAAARRRVPRARSSYSSMSHGLRLCVKLFIHKEGHNPACFKTGNSSRSSSSSRERNLRV
jgi:hypothetical protein